MLVSLRHCDGRVLRIVQRDYHFWTGNRILLRRTWKMPAFVTSFYFFCGESGRRSRNNRPAPGEVTRLLVLCFWTRFLWSLITRREFQLWSVCLSHSTHPCPFLQMPSTRQGGDQFQFCKSLDYRR